jgi:hypothetical protein
VAPIKDSAIRLLSLKLILNPKSILGQNNRDFTRNNKSINYNSVRGVNPNSTSNIYSS